MYCCRRAEAFITELLPPQEKRGAPATWDKGYRPVLEMAVSLLTGARAPGRPVDLIDRCVADWAPGSRMRQIRCQSLSQFHRHCVEREQFPAHWLPPSDLSYHVGRKPVGSEGNGGGARCQLRRRRLSNRHRTISRSMSPTWVVRLRDR